MSFLEVANHPFVYVACGIAILIVIIILLNFLRLSIKRAKEIGYSNSDLLKVVKTTLIVSIGPALSILIPMLALIKVLGRPFSWLRLSVIGSASMEMILANWALSSNGYGALGTDLPGVAFGAVALVVGCSVIDGMLINIFLNKRVSQSLDKMRNTNMEFTNMLTETLFGSFIGALAVPSMMESAVSFASAITGFVFFLIIIFLIRKLNLKKMNEYSFAIALIGGMLMAILWNSLLGGM